MRFIPSGRGHMVLMLEEHTFAKVKSSDNRYWHCSRRKQNRCRARVTLDKKGKIKFSDLVHNHLPPNYRITSKGFYVKDLCRYPKNPTEQQLAVKKKIEEQQKMWEQGPLVLNEQQKLWELMAAKEIAEREKLWEQTLDSKSSRKAKDDKKEQGPLVLNEQQKFWELMAAKEIAEREKPWKQTLNSKKSRKSVKKDDKKDSSDDSWDGYSIPVAVKIESAEKED